MPLNDTKWQPFFKISQHFGPCHVHFQQPFGLPIAQSFWPRKRHQKNQPARRSTQHGPWSLHQLPSLCSPVGTKEDILGLRIPKSELQNVRCLFFDHVTSAVRKWSFAIQGFSSLEKKRLITWQIARWVWTLWTLEPHLLSQLLIFCPQGIVVRLAQAAFSVFQVRSWWIRAWQKDLIRLDACTADSRIVRSSTSSWRTLWVTWSRATTGSDDKRWLVD